MIGSLESRKDNFRDSLRTRQEALLDPSALKATREAGCDGGGQDRTGQGESLQNEKAKLKASTDNPPPHRKPIPNLPA